MKQDAAEHGLKKKSNEKLKKKTLRQMKIEIQHTKIYGMQQKQF